MQKHIDLLVENGDFVLDVAGFASSVSDRQSIGQDIMHRIIESGLLALLIGQRSPIERDVIINRLIIEVEKDQRLKPGTVRLLPLESQESVYYLTATTLEYGELNVTL